MDHREQILINATAHNAHRLASDLLAPAKFVWAGPPFSSTHEAKQEWGLVEGKKASGLQFKSITANGKSKILIGRFTSQKCWQGNIG